MTQLKGAFFAASRPVKVAARVQRLQHDVALTAEGRVHAMLASSLKNPTGYYDSRVRTVNTSDTSVVTDSGVVYSAWLEGVSSRNRSTRFKGYHAFRRAAQSMSGLAGEMGERTARDIVKELS